MITDQTNEVSRLLDPRLDELTSKMVADAAERDEAARRAIAEPLPGQARQAFAVDQAIEAGGYRVRPACDYDVEILDQLESKFGEFFKSGKDADILPTGHHAWELCHLMTTPPEDVDEFVAQHGLAAFKEAAKKRFAFAPQKTIAKVVMAAFKQMFRSFSDVPEHVPADVAGESTEAARSDHPPS